MKQTFKQIFAAAAALCMTPMLSACGEEDYYITFENLSGVEIAEIHATLENDKTDAANLLTENLKDGEQISIKVGEFTEEEVTQGFYMEAHSAEDGSYQTFNMLMVKNGGLVTFYMDSIELCVAVDCTHEEIEEMIERSKEDVESAATTTTEATTTTTTETTTTCTEETTAASAS